MPIWGAFFLLRLHRVQFFWVDFARHGEFGLYAAAFLAPAIYQILKSIRRDKFPLRAGSVLIAVVGILMAAFIYAATNPQFGPSVPPQGEKIDETYLMEISGTLLALAFVFSFFVTLMDTAVNDPDLAYLEKVDQAFLRSEVAVERPEPAPAVTDDVDSHDNEFASSDDLKQRFNADRATEGETNAR